MKLAFNKIVLDDRIYPRTHVNEFNIARLAHAFDSGATFPPLTIESGSNRLVDGWHRYETYKRKGVATVEVTKKAYTTEADLFADAVRLNIGHGEPLDQFTIRNAIIRLNRYGYSREQITEVVRLPADQLDKIERGFASSKETGEPIALKGGLNHLRGQSLDGQQQQVNRNYSGGKAVFYVRQICDLLEHDMWPNSSASFDSEMDRLVGLWTAIVATRSADKAA